jgi:hypothetical protein
MTDLHPHREHGLPAKDSLRARIALIITCVCTLVALLAYGHHVDSQAEADDAALEQRIADHISERQRAVEWTHRMAQAYAAGRHDALADAAAQGRVLTACATPRGEPQ